MSHRLLVVLGVLLGLAFAGPVAVAAQDATPPAGSADTGNESDIARTDARYILPFTQDGLNPDLTVSATEAGGCGFEAAAALGRPDAWDCISASNQISDPCFENPFTPPDEPGQVACFESPVTADVVVLDLTEPLVREKEATADPGPGPTLVNDHDEAIEPWDLPWALELANGGRCTLLHGTLMEFAGQVAHYGCTGGGIVLGETNRSEPIWTVSYLAEGDYASSLVEVRAAWS